MQIAVIYWTGSGNTELMAQAVAEGAREAGAAVSLTPVAGINADTAAGYDRLALGCPAMGAEVLEESEFEPFFSSLEDRLGSKKLALFGSYGWGDGEWMQNWEQTCRDGGVNLVCDSVTCCEAPEADALSACEALGAALAQ